MRRVDIELPEQLIDKSGECWLWLGPTNEDGYGYHKRQRVHRVALAKKLGRPLVAMALHSCRVPGCCNPDHLREGTHLDNMRDMADHGTHDGKNRRGEKHPLAKLTDKQRKEIRDSPSSGVKLAAQFDVSPGCISMIRGKLPPRLSDKQKQRIKTSTLSCGKLSTIFGMSKSTVHNIKVGNYEH